MANTLVMCGYGDEELGADCCLVSDGETASYARCRVVDWEECPFGERVVGCGTCAHASGMSLDADGNRIVDCGANEMQMYQPYATECRRWERALG